MIGFASMTTIVWYWFQIVIVIRIFGRCSTLPEFLKYKIISLVPREFYKLKFDKGWGSESLDPCKQCKRVLLADEVFINFSNIFFCIELELENYVKIFKTLLLKF